MNTILLTLAAWIIVTYLGAYLFDKYTVDILSWLRYLTAMKSKSDCHKKCRNDINKDCCGDCGNKNDDLHS